MMKILWRKEKSVSDKQTGEERQKALQTGVR